MPSIKSFNITLGDINFLLDQLRHTIVVVGWDSTTGQPTYGYRDASSATGYHELGPFGSFDPLLVNGPDGLPIYQGARDAAGMRILDGFFNNLTGTTATPGAWLWGSVNEPFPRLTPAQYNHYVHQVVDNPALATYQAAHPSFIPIADSSALYADPSKTVVDYTPRMITQTISSSYMDHAPGVADSAFARTDIATDTFTETVTYADGTTAQIQESIIRNQNTLPGDPSTSGIFTLFGQFFDHGLDFIDKGGQGTKIVIALDPSDPLYRAPNGSDPGNTTITISRATPDGHTFLDVHGRPVSIAGADGVWNTIDDRPNLASLGADGVVSGDDTHSPVAQPTGPATYTDHTSPYIDQSQSYGSDEQITNLLRQWVQDPNTHQYRPGAELLDGHQTQAYNSQVFNDSSPNGLGVGMTTRTVPTLNELRAHMAATGRGDANSVLTWDDINNYRERDANGDVIDTNGGTIGGYVYTGQALLLDMNPHFDNKPGHLTQADVTELNTAAGLPAGTLHFYVSTGPGDPNADKAGQLTDGTNFGAFALAPWVNFANFSIMATDPAVYNAVGNILMDAIGDHYIAGDGRANENFGLTALHHVFHENHNVQLVNLENNILAQADLASRNNFQLGVNNGSGGFYTDAQGNYTLADHTTVSWDPDKMFAVAKLVNEMEYQHVAIDQYARLVTPDLPEFVTYDSNINADISLEYSQAAFRFGHSQLRETIDAIDPNGMVTKIALSSAFLNPAQFAATGASDILRGMSQQVSNEVDEFLTPAMQQSLLGQALDLGAINIARGRDVGLPTLNETRRALHDALVAERAADPTTPHHTNLIVDALNPYTSWVDFGSQMLHPESLVNFIAAYAFDGNLAKAQAIVGLDAGTITEGSADAQGFTYDQAVNFLNDSLASGDALAAGANAYNDIDLWIGGLAEVHVFTGQLGTTFNAIFEDQMERLMDGDRFYYLYRLGLALPINTDLNQAIATEQFRDIIERTTGVLHLNGDVMGYADSYIELGKTLTPGQNLLAYKGEVIHDASGALVTANQGDIKYQQVGSSWVPILADYKTAHNYGQQIAEYAAAHPGEEIGIYSGPGAGTVGNGGFITKSNADLGIVNQLYFRDFRPNLGTNDDGTDNQGFDSHEVLSGTDYKDFILAGNGDDTVYGDKGDDVLDGQGGADHLYGGDGQDVLYGGDIEDFVDGGKGDDIVYGGTSAGALDVVIGGDGNDKLYGEAGIDEIYGGAGDDYIDAGGDTDLAFGDGGNDIMFGGDGPDELRGGLGDDMLSGGSGPDMLKGEGGDDIMFGGIGQTAQNGDSDELLGDVGFDIAAYSDLNVALDVAADLRNQNLTAAGGTTPFNPFNQLLVDVQGLIGSKFDDKFGATPTDQAGRAGLIGDDTDNWLIGGGGADTFGTRLANTDGTTGSGGNDVIIGDSIRLDTLIGTYGGGYANGVDSDGNATHAVSGPLGTNGLLDVAGVGTFAKHFTDLLATERNKDLVLGQDTGTAATSAANADIAVFTGNKADYTLTKIDFVSAHEGAITAYKIVDNRAGSPDGTDLLVGIEKLQFADQTVSLIIQAPVLDLHAFDSGNYRDEFSSSSFTNSNGSQAWAAAPWSETGDGANTAGTGQIQIDGGGGGGTNQLRFLGGVGAGFDGGSIQRTVNLAGVTSATLSYTFDRNNIDPGETVTVQFSADGVNFNQTVQTITSTSGGGGGSGTTTVALTGPFTATSAIRFVATGINATNEEVRIDNVNIAFVKPVSDGLNYTTSYTEDGAALPIAVNPGITDDGTVIVSAKAVLTNAVAGDRLTISGGLPAGISSSLTSVAGVITLALTGSATLAQYQTALAQIRFDSTSDGPTGADRTINVTVNDGFVDSNVAVATVHVTPVNDAPTAGNDRIVTNIALGTMFTVPDSALLVNDADPDSTLTISGISGVSGLTIAAHPAGGPVSITDTGSAGGSFNYAASDGIAPADNASVTVARDADGTLTGNDSNSTADILVGDGTGTNFDGGTGNDIIFAGAGNDTILYTTGDGADRVDGEAGSDTLVITDGNGSSTLDIVLSGSTIIGFEGGTLANVESVTAALGNGTDTLSYAGTATALNVDLGTNTATGFTSASGIDNVVGGSASDNFVGSAGSNIFTGGGGNDTINGAGGTDTAVFSGAAADHAYSLVASSLVVSDLRVGNPDGTDTLTSIEQLQLGGQTLTLQLGTAAANTLNATGNDDLLIGFAGNDTFAFGSAGNADGDVILDFTAGQDHIDVLAIDASPASGNNAFTFIDHSNPGDTGTGITGLGQLSYYLDGATGHYMLAGNTTGSTTPEFMIDLGTPHKTLSAADFVL